MGHVDINSVSFVLPDGRPLLSDVSLRVGEGAKVALIGPNGTGKTTLGRIVAGDLAAHEGAVTRSGGLGIMRQFVGKVRDDSTVRDLLVSVAPDPVRWAAAEIDRTELLMMERDTEQDQLSYAQALVDWADAGGYDYETLWDVCTVAALGVPSSRRSGARSAPSRAGSRSAWCSRRCCAGRRRCSCSTSRTTTWTSPRSGGWRTSSSSRPRLVLFVSHDRELLERVATRIATLEPGAAGSTLWVHPGRFSTYHQARVDRSRSSTRCAGAGTRSTPSSRHSS